MVVFALIGLALCVAFVPAGLFAMRRGRTPAEPREDWWPRFEAEFRAYAARVSTSPQHGEARRQPPPR